MHFTYVRTSMTKIKSMISTPNRTHRHIRRSFRAQEEEHDQKKKLRPNAVFTTANLNRQFIRNITLNKIKIYSEEI